MARRDRAPDELRPVRITRGFTDMTAGSVLIEMGQTRVLVHRLGRYRRPALDEGQGRGLGDRRVRDAAWVVR